MVGCLIWGCMTLGFSLAPNIHVAIAFWAVNGLGLSLVIPNVQVRLVMLPCSCTLFLLGPAKAC